MVEFEGFERKAPEELPNKKNPFFDHIAPNLKIDENGVGVWLDPESGNKAVFKTMKGICKSNTITNGIIK